MKNKKLRIAHYPQIQCEPFEVEVTDLYEAKKIMDVLAKYDLFQYKNRIKGDYANMTILKEFCEEEQEWYEIEIDDIE